MMHTEPEASIDSNNDGLVAAYILDGHGGARQLKDWSEVQQWHKGQGLLWVHIDCNDQTVGGHLEQLPDLNPIAIEALLLNETRPRSDYIAPGLLVALRGVNTNPGADPDDMVALRIWLESDRIITSRRRRLKTVEAIRHQIEKNKGPHNPGEFFVMIVDFMSGLIAEVVENIDSAIDDVEDDIDSSHEMIRASRIRLTELRRQCATLRRYIAPQRDALERLHREPNPVLNDSCRLELREDSDRFRRYVEDLDLAREKIMVLQEQLLTMLSEQQNKRMYVLSVVAAIFLPLTFVTGLLGMNVGGIPGEGQPGAFTLLVIGMAVVAGILILLFKSRKWL